MRARIDMSEIEAQTKIRAKYLRALENEEWDLLPGPTSTSRASCAPTATLGLDGKALVEEYKRQYERPSDNELRPIVHRCSRERERAAARAPRVPPWAIVGVVLVGIVAALYFVGSQSATTRRPTIPRRPAPRPISRPSTARGSQAQAAAHRPCPPRPRPSRCSSCRPATVYVCLSRTAPAQADPGRIFAAGETIPTYQREQASDHARQQLGADEGRRQGRPGGAVEPRSATRSRRRRDAAAVRPRSRPAHERRERPSAGIVVTGTEVLTGIVSDRNGPWLSDRLRELGVDPAIIHDRRRPPRGHARGAASSWPRRGWRWSSPAAASGRPPTT